MDLNDQIDQLEKTAQNQEMHFGPDLTEVDKEVLQLPYWKDLELVSWEAFEARYQQGKFLGHGSYAEVIEVLVVLKFPAAADLHR